MSQLAMQDGALLVCDGSLSSECCEPGEPPDFEIPCERFFGIPSPIINCKGFCDDILLHVDGLIMHRHGAGGIPIPLCEEPMSFTIPCFFQSSGSLQCRWFGVGPDNTMCPGFTHTRALFATVIKEREDDKQGGNQIGFIWHTLFRVESSGLPGQNHTILSYVIPGASGQPGCPPANGWEFCGPEGIFFIFVDDPGVLTITTA